MSKQKNINIGHVKCFSCGDLAAVRKNVNGALYYDCLECGRNPLNHAGGQRRIQEQAVIWGANGAPAEIPRWIREQWPYAVAIRLRDKKDSEGGAGKATAPGSKRTAPEAAAGDLEAPAAAAAPDPDELPATPQPPRRRAPQPVKPNPTEPDPLDEPPSGKGIIGEAWDEL